MRRYIKCNFTFWKTEKPCWLPAVCVFYICKSLHITEQPSCLPQPHKRLLSSEMFVINVTDDFFFYNCILEIYYFVITYLGIAPFQVTRLQAENWHEYPNACSIYYLNLLVYLFYMVFFRVYRDFAFPSIANLSKNTASVAWGRRMS